MKKAICVIVLLCAISICAASSGWGADLMQPMVAAGPIEWSAQRSAFRPELWTEYNGRPMFTNADLPDFIKNKETIFKGVEVATGASVTKEALLLLSKKR